MTESNKNKWAYNSSFDQATKQTFAFLTKCRSKNILQNDTTSLFHVWKIDGHFDLTSYSGCSSFFSFSVKDPITVNVARNQVIRALSAFLNGFFFLSPQATNTFEPHCVFIPDLFKPTKPTLCLICSMEENGALFSYIISDIDMSMVASSLLPFNYNHRIGVVISHSSFKWLEIKKWRVLKESAIESGTPWFLWKKWNDKKQYTSQLLENVETIDPKYGTVLHYDRIWNQELIHLGAEWIPEMNQWVLPIGKDTELAHEYLNIITKLSPQDYRKKIGCNAFQTLRNNTWAT